MFGRKPFTSKDFDFDAVTKEKGLELLRREMSKATIHFGEGRMNPSTIASIFALIEERLTGHPSTKSSSSFESRTFFESVGMTQSRKNS
jgi:hypothetical protein